MYQLTTPILSVGFNKDLFTTSERIVLTFSQYGKVLAKLEKDRMSFSEDATRTYPYIITVELTAEETSKFAPVPVKIQFQFKDANDKIKASCIKEIDVKEVLNKEVI